MWGPQLKVIVDIIIQGALVYPNCITKYINDNIVPVAYEINVGQNTPLPEDEIEEKNMDLSEVESKVMSRKSYMKKWRGLTDDEVQEELEQIALERTIIEDASFEGGFESPYLEEVMDNNLDDEDANNIDDIDDDVWDDDKKLFQKN